MELVQGNIFDARVDAIVNTVNCVGVMGRGLARQFKERYPANYKAYKRACDTKQVTTGKMFVYVHSPLLSPKYIINFPTKNHWRNPSRIEDIEAGLHDLVRVIQHYNLGSIAIPPLGSGLGGLSWETQVLPLIRTILQPVQDATRIVIYSPLNEDAPTTPRPPRSTPALTPGRAALLVLMHNYTSALLDPFITLLEVHKLMYFLQVRGEPLKLMFTKGHYGPYAENLRHVLRHMDGTMIDGYGDDGDVPTKQLSPRSDVVEEALEYIQKHSETAARMNATASLIDGFESAYGLELLATVHWVLTQEHIVTHDALIAAVHDWNDRKKQFTPRQITIAAERLKQHGLTRFIPEAPPAANLRLPVY